MREGSKCSFLHFCKTLRLTEVGPQRWPGRALQAHTVLPPGPYSSAGPLLLHWGPDNLAGVSDRLSWAQLEQALSLSATAFYLLLQFPSLWP